MSEICPRLGVKAMVVRDGAVLMNRSRVRSADGVEREVFDLPGGGHQWGETQEQALVRECLEEVGARVIVHGVACVYECLTRAVDDSEPSRDGLVAHQVNVAFWCGLAPGEEPSIGPVPDGAQLGTSWLPILELDRFEVWPREIADWLMADPSIGPTGLGPIDLPGGL